MAGENQGVSGTDERISGAASQGKNRIGKKWLDTMEKGLERNSNKMTATEIDELKDVIEYKKKLIQTLEGMHP